MKLQAEVQEHERMREVLKKDISKLKDELSLFKNAINHCTEDGYSKRHTSSSDGWSILNSDYLSELEVKEEKLDLIKEELKKYKEINKKAWDKAYENTKQLFTKEIIDRLHYMLED
jgi:chromosome segregation ATPase